MPKLLIILDSNDGHVTHAITDDPTLEVQVVDIDIEAEEPVWGPQDTGIAVVVPDVDLAGIKHIQALVPEYKPEENDGEEKASDADSQRIFHKSTIVYEVLSEVPLSQDAGLAEIERLCDDGDYYSGRWVGIKEEQIDGPTMVKLLEEHHTQSGYFGLDHQGKDTMGRLEEDEENETSLPSLAIVCVKKANQALFEVGMSAAFDLTVEDTFKQDEETNILCFSVREKNEEEREPIATFLDEQCKAGIITPYEGPALKEHEAIK